MFGYVIKVTSYQFGWSVCSDIEVYVFCVFMFLFLGMNAHVTLQPTHTTVEASISDISVFDHFPNTVYRKVITCHILLPF